MNKLDKSEKRDKFLGRYNLLKLIFKKSRRIMCRGIINKSSISNENDCLQGKIQAQMVLQVNYIRHLKKKWQLITHSFRKIVEEGRIPNSFYEFNITLMLKPKKCITNYETVSLVNINIKFLSKVLTNWIQQYIKRIIKLDRVVFIPKM